MKILLINSQLPPRVSGISIHFGYLARTFQSMGHIVERIGANDYKGGEDFIDGIKTYKYSRPDKSLKYWEGVKQELINSKNILNKLLVKNQYDLIVLGNYVFLQEVKRYVEPDKILYYFSSLLYTKDFHNENAKNVKRYISSLIKGIYLIASSNFLKSEILDELKPQQEVQVVPLGVDLLRFRPPLKIIRKELVLFIGRLNKEKNISALIKLFKFVKRKSNLFIIGTGKEKNDLINLTNNLKLKSSVKFLGKLIEVRKYYQEAKVFVLPSIYETFGLVLLEALASGVPCIAFKPDGKKYKTGVADIIDNNINGFLVKSEKEMAAKIDLLLSDEELWKRMSKEAINKAKNFTWEKHVDKLLNIVKK